MSPGKLLYKSIYGELKKGIKDGRFPVGSFLPAEGELCARFAVSRTTIRKALGMLENEGHLRIRQGRGTEVLDASTTQKLSHITSITETLRARGYDVTVQGMSIQRQLVPDFLMDKLLLTAKQEIYKVERLLYADARPIAYIVNYLDARRVPQLENHVNAFTGLYSFLESTYHIIPTQAMETLSAVVADFTQSQLLQVPLGAPLLWSRRLSNADGRPFEYSDSRLVADRYEYSIYLEGRAAAR